MSPERRLREHESQWVVLAIGRGILTIGVILGVLIVLGGKQRWSSPSYEVALTYPYAPESWGWVLGVFSIAGLVGSLTSRLRLVSIGLYLIAVWCLFFSFSFIQTAVGNPSAATTGIPIYLGTAVCACLIGVLHWRSAQDAPHH